MEATDDGSYRRMDRVQWKPQTTGQRVVGRTDGVTLEWEQSHVAGG